MEPVYKIGDKLYTESKLIEIINSSPIAIKEGITTKKIKIPKKSPSPVRSRSPGVSVKSKSRHRSPARSTKVKSRKQSPVRERSPEISTKSNPRKKSPAKRIPIVFSSSSSSDSIDFTEEQLASILFDVFDEYFGFSPQQLPNYNQLYAAVRDELIEYYTDGGGTMEIDSLISAIAIFLFNRPWPRYSDGPDAHRAFQDALNALQQKYQR